MKDKEIMEEGQVEIQERGDIYFLYRPKVGKEEAHSADDVQRLYIILRPESGEEKQDSHSASGSDGGHGSQKVNIELEKPLFRLIVMGRKKLPDATQKRRSFWGFVEMVTTDAEDVKAALKGEEYETKSRGHRHSSDARGVGEGVYRILRHKASGHSHMHTHLVYKLEFPSEDEEGQPQESLNIEREGSFIIQIKNPESESGRFRGLQNKRKAVFPAHLQGQLGHVKFAPADPPHLLNYQGCELLLISASHHIQQELGLDLQTEGGPDASCSHLLTTFGDTVSATPLLKGTWL
ncbi:uncharacterized protein G2W53_000016 [Senna tora]|uniref:Uncharacterized protein n=1 Tax=Senna tora TaxID=362788 RepID=A0A834XFP0_9FABA|nr:uncharacterized protein G2W53_000016 [Senna tora]